MILQGRKDRFNDYFELGLYVLAAGCMIYFLITGYGAKTFQAVLTAVVLLLIRLVIKLGKLDLFPALRFAVLLFVFVTMILANAFGFYGVIPHLDKIEHLFSGVILYLVGLAIFAKINRAEDGAASAARSLTAIWFSLFFAVAMAGIWEIYEFAIDRSFGLSSQAGSLVDTMVDIICGTAGALAAGLFFFARRKRKLALSSTMLENCTVY